MMAMSLIGLSILLQKKYSYNNGHLKGYGKGVHDGWYACMDSVMVIINKQIKADSTTVSKVYVILERDSTAKIDTIVYYLSHKDAKKK